MSRYIHTAQKTGPKISCDSTFKYPGNAKRQSGNPPNCQFLHHRRVGPIDTQLCSHFTLSYLNSLLASNLNSWLSLKNSYSPLFIKTGLGKIQDLLLSLSFCSELENNSVILMLFFVVINCMSRGQDNGARRGMGAGGEMVVGEEIEQLTVSMRLVYREARHCRPGHHPQGKVILLSIQHALHSVCICI
jgi:hypothetical protein